MITHTTTQLLEYPQNNILHYSSYTHTHSTITQPLDYRHHDTTSGVPVEQHTPLVIRHTHTVNYNTTTGLHTPEQNYWSTCRTTYSTTRHTHTHSTTTQPLVYTLHNTTTGVSADQHTPLLITHTQTLNYNTATGLQTCRHMQTHAHTITEMQVKIKVIQLQIYYL